MPSKLNAYLVSAVMLAALLQCAPGAPVVDAPTDSPAGDTSGEEGEEGETSSGLESNSGLWKSLSGASEQHKQQFEEEFPGQIINYLSLNEDKTSSFPASFPSDFSKEACLRQWAQGLLIYTVLLKHVEKEYPSSQILSDAKHYSNLLIDLIKKKMRNPDAVTAVTSSKEEQLLKDLDDPDLFRRKMTAHSILSHLYDFIFDGKRAITKKELRGSRANRSVAHITYFDQMLR